MSSALVLIFLTIGTAGLFSLARQYDTSVGVINNLTTK